MNPSSTEAKRWLGRWWGDTRADARKLGAIVPLAAQAQFFRIGAEASLPEVATSPAEDPAPQLPKAEPTVSPPSTPTGKKTELEAGQPVSRRGRSSSPAAARVKAQPQPEDTPGAGSSTGPPRGCSAPAARRSSEPEPKTLPAPKNAAQVRMRQHKELDSAGLGKLVCWEWGHSVGGQHSVAQDPVTRCPNCGLRTLLDLKRFVPVAHGAVPVLRRSSDKPGEGQPENTEDWQGVPQSQGSVPTVVL